MKIVVFDNLSDGGAKRVVFEQVKGLAKNHKVYYITGTKSDFFKFEKYAIGTYYFDLELPVHRGLFRPLTELGLITWLLPQYQRIARQIRELKAEVTIAHPSKWTQAPILLNLVSPIIYYAEEWLRIVYEPQNYVTPDDKIIRKYESLRRSMLKAVDWMNVKSASTVILNSNFTRSNYIRAYGRRKYRVIHPGVDLQTFYPARNNKKYFLFIGEKEDINGYRLLKEALLHSPIPFAVKYVEFGKKGFSYTDKELNNLYQQAVATLCLAINEPFGLSAVESMTAGTPVIAVSEGGYPETVVNNKTGVLIERSAEKLYGAMKKMAVDNEFRSSLAKECRKHTEINFSWKGHIEKLNKVIVEAVK